MAKNQPQAPEAAKPFTFETDDERRIWFEVVERFMPSAPSVGAALLVGDQFVLEVRKRTKASASPKELPEGSWPKLVERIAKYQAWNIDLDDDTEAPEGLDGILADLLIAVGRIPAARK